MIMNSTQSQASLGKVIALAVVIGIIITVISQIIQRLVWGEARSGASGAVAILAVFVAFWAIRRKSN
jgi:ABC-type Fe3+-siderophore transport system permease subunit